MIRMILLVAVVAACAGCPQSTPSVLVPSTPVAQPKSISGASPFAKGCAPEADSFGDRIEDAEMETHIAVNPRNPANIVVVWMQDLFSGFVVATTADGGGSWTTVPVPGTSTCSGGAYDLAADPRVEFGRDGVLYLSGFSLDLPASETPAPSRTRLFSMTSRDGGLSWGAAVEIAGGYGALHDMPFIATDPNRDCTAHIAWTEETTAFGPVSTALRYSSTQDCGQSWSTPVAVDQPLLSTNPFAVLAGSKIMSLRDGSLLVVATAMSSLLAMSRPDAPAHQPHALVAFRSTDQGATWSSPVTVADFPYGDFRDPETDQPVLHSSFLISAAAAPDGSVYIAYRGQTAADAADIRIVKSPDGGMTWGNPVVVRDVGTQMMNPAVAVREDGVVGVTYYDTRNDLLADLSLSTDLWFSQSDDGGASWRESHLAGSFDLRAAATMKVPVEGLMVGEYMGLAAVPGGFVASFAQSGAPATVGASDIFFARP